MISDSDAVVNPGTMVVKNTNTPIADKTVTTPFTFYHFAVKANPLANLILVGSLIVSLFNQCLKLQIWILANVARLSANRKGKKH